MDLNTVASFEQPRTRDELPRFRGGDAWLAGGTWLFSEPQPTLRRLIDLTGLGWPPIETTHVGLFVAATCTVAAFDAFTAPTDWRARPLIGQCCSAFLASFKVCTVATVGGNICLGLPAAPMISLAVALDATCVVWAADGSERRVPVLDVVIGPQQTSLAPGEVLRGIEIGAEALRRVTAFRRISLTAQGRSGALVIGTRDECGDIALTVTAATRRPRRVVLPADIDPAALPALLDEAIPPSDYHDDIHGRPDWRRHVTLMFAAEILAELSARQA